jgi:branched-chain amino acid transport system ATP-binding protein
VIASSDSILEVRGVRKRYATLTALDGVDLTIAAASFHGLIGPNGSGKTTLLKCIAGADMPTNGEIIFLGRDITSASPAARARAGINLKFQITSVVPNLTVYDNVLLALQSRSSIGSLLLSRTRRAKQNDAMIRLAQFRLDTYQAEPAASLSHGQQQWLEIAMALCCGPQLLLLDEPTAGMSPQERRATGELLAPIREHCSVLIVEHDLDFIKDICDTLTVLDQGVVIESGPTRRVQDSQKVKEVYLAHV